MKNFQQSTEMAGKVDELMGELELIELEDRLEMVQVAAVDDSLADDNSACGNSCCVSTD